jgi:hypothetical protein
MPKVATACGRQQKVPSAGAFTPKTVFPLRTSPHLRARGTFMRANDRPGSVRSGSCGRIEGRKHTMLKSALLVTAGIAIGFGVNAVLAQSNAPYYNVAAINVIDKDGYEASGVDKVREAIKANGGAIIAGGYNKAVAIDSDTQPANRLLIVRYPSKDASDKANEVTKGWAEKVKGKYTDRFRIFGVEGVESK